MAKRKEKEKMTNNDLQNTTQKTNIEQHEYYPQITWRVYYGWFYYSAGVWLVGICPHFHHYF